MTICNNIFSSPAYFIVRRLYITYVMQKMGVNCLSVRLLVNSGLLVIKVLRS